MFICVDVDETSAVTGTINRHCPLADCLLDCILIDAKEKKMLTKVFLFSILKYSQVFKFIFVNATLNIMFAF